MSGISKQEFNQFKAQLMAQLCELKTCGSCCDNKEEKLVREVTVSGNTFFVTYNDGTVKTFTIGSTGGPNPVFVTNIDVTPAGYLVFYSDGTTEILASNSSDELVKISSSDTNSKFLEDALNIKGTAGLTDPMLVRLNSGANEELEINIPKVIVENTTITYSQADINSILKLYSKSDIIIDFPGALDPLKVNGSSLTTNKITDKFNKITTLQGTFRFNTSANLFGSFGLLNTLILFSNNKIASYFKIDDSIKTKSQKYFGQANLNIFDTGRTIQTQSGPKVLLNFNKNSVSTCELSTNLNNDGDLKLIADFNHNAFAEYDNNSVQTTLPEIVPYDPRPYLVTFTFTITYENKY